MSEETKSVVSFKYHSTEFRGMQNDDGSLWFVAKDACGVLGYADRGMPSEFWMRTKGGRK
jgi:prophage antirepressor-like protein